MSPLAEHLATGTTTIARAWIVRRSDGAVFGFTDHDVPLVVEGVTCRAASGLSAGALATSTGLSVDNSEASGALSDDAISEADIRSGLWDAANIISYIVNWIAPEDHEVLFSGSLGEIAWSDGAFSAELRGAAEILNKARGRVYQARCDAVLGDARCRKVLEPGHRIEAGVIGVEDAQVIAVDVGTELPAGTFDRGRMIVLDGAAEGQSERIKTDRFVDGQRRMAVWTSFRKPIAVGDRVRIEVGCDKRMETCRTKFDNLHNFRGFPHIPGEDWLIAYPTKDGANNGGRL